jgi:hypothetical protein
MSDTTNINELPGNISMETNEVVQKVNLSYSPNNVPEQVVQSNQNQPGNLEIDAQQMNQQTNTIVPNSQAEMNKFISGLQQANVSGVTTIQQRDVPQSTTDLTQDESIKPNFIPDPEENNNIPANLNEINQQLDQKYIQNNKKDNSLDNVIEELQIPILLGLLYFCFQLPGVKMFLYKHFPSFYLDDGNFNLKGLLFVSTLFGFLYFIFNKMINIFI